MSREYEQLLIDHAEEVRRWRRQVEICQGCPKLFTIYPKLYRCIADPLYMGKSDFEQRLIPKGCNRRLEYMILCQTPFA